MKNKDEYKTIFNKYVSCVLLLNYKNSDENKINNLYNIIYDLLKSNDKSNILLRYILLYVNYI